LEQLVNILAFTTFTVKSETPLSASSSSYKTTCGIKQIISSRYTHKCQEEKMNMVL
jgi:hypothetical protein